MKFNFRKIAAVGASLLMAGMTAGVAAAANYPAPFVDGGVANVAVVYGSGTGVSALDAVEAANIQTNLGTYVTSTGVTPTTGDFIALDTDATKIWLNTSLNTAKTTFTKSDLPVVLQDYTFSGNVDSKMTSTIKFASGAAAGGDNSGKVIFAKQPSSSNDPEFGVSMGSSQTSSPLYNATITFGSAVAFNNTDSEGETIRFFGQDFVVSTATDATSLVLFSSAEEITLSAGGTNPNPSSTVSIGGTDYLIELVSASDTSAWISVDGDSKEITEGNSKKIGGIEVAVKAADENTAMSTLTVSLLIGSEKLKFTSGSQVLKGSDEDPVDGTYVWFTGTPNALTGLTITVFRPSSGNDAILPGNTFNDPAFGSFDVYFEGMNSDVGSADRETISIKNSGDDTMMVTFADDGGNSGTIDLAHNQSNMWRLATDNNYTINVIEMANLSENEYIVLGNQDYGHILQLTDIYNQTTGTSAITNDRVKFQDALTGADGIKATYSTTFSSTEGSGTLNLDGKEYTITFGGSDDSGWATVKYPTGDSASANAFVVYPTVKTSKGALVSLYEPLDLNLANGDGGGSDMTTLNFPDGEGYTAITLTYYAVNDDATWNVTGQAAAINTSVASSYKTFTVGKLTYNLTSTATDNQTKLYVTNPEDSTTNIDNPGLIMFEGKDDQNVYEAVVVDLEGNAASMGTSTNGVGVNDVLFSSTRYHASGTLASDSDHTKDVDMWGTITLINADDSDQKTLEISYPKSQVYAKLYIGETTALESASTGGIGSVIVKDTEVSSVASKNLIVVGGSCINSAAAALVGGAYCGESWTTATGIGSGQFLVKSYTSGITGNNFALLVAGYEKEDTQAASTYVTTQEFDTSTVAYTGPVENTV